MSAAGFRAVAFDYPGLGLAERPRDFDYSSTGLARFVGEALDALGVDRLHLVVHDIGGPIGCEWAAREPERVISLTVTNTALNLASFGDPWMFRWTAVPGLRVLVLALMNRYAFARLVYRHGGVSDASAVPRADVDAHYELLKREDGGRAFVEINNGWIDPAKEAPLRDALARRSYPAQVIWGGRDPVLGPDVRRYAESVLGVEGSLLLPAGHFLQEEQPHPIAEAIVRFARAVEEG